MNYISVVLIICLSGVVGNVLAKRYVERDGFYKELATMCMYFKNNISFSQTKVSELFEYYIKEYSPKYKNQFFKMKQMLEEKQNNLCALDVRLFYFLKKEERLEIENFLKSFGTNDIESEINKINNFEHLVNTKKDEISNQRKKNEGLVYKLSISIGAVLCILIL